MPPSQPTRSEPHTAPEHGRAHHPDDDALTAAHRRAMFGQRDGDAPGPDLGRRRLWPWIVGVLLALLVATQLMIHARGRPAPPAPATARGAR